MLGTVALCYQHQLTSKSCDCPVTADRVSSEGQQCPALYSNQLIE